MTDNAMPRILLTGANGQVGWELQRSLASLGEVVAVHRQGLDLSDADQIRKIVQDVRPGVIVNAAAYTAVDKAEEEEALAMAVNGTAPGVFAEQARAIGAALIHYSTDYVFDGSGDTPWTEQDPAGPLNVYGKSKLAGEQAVAAAGAPHLILRTSWVYGLHGNNFVKTMLRLGAERKDLSIVDDQIGAPTSARVIADVTAQIIAQAKGDAVGYLTGQGGLYHLTCRGATSWYGFAEEIFRLARARGLPLALETVNAIPSSAYPVPATRPLNSRLNCEKLREYFALQPPTWQYALQQSLPIPFG